MKRGHIVGGLDLAVVPKVARGPLGTTLQIRVDAALLNRLDHVCAETGRKRSDVARLLMEAGLDLHERDKRGGKR